ncbi:hypothetical protein PHYSODRAFT_330898 [Phytophthora sojae]|uniref:Uncharacterized protein n=1 Tax=Phytophthora sojae (strain P6497) TaxID=1094619 RepID=G4ZIG6_PHYSP|nr:hypothetical protein PHYSODRAFT_330898 [Phytophthora sojae]EGZ16830.1 hypothetical protein PHYSODRAFT_330898 [Phytophthora sojae]|eukprot:XP_009525888.1 hypothetical protein PHYSODRAFT_330898 [Phytophthora sojae]
MADPAWGTASSLSDEETARALCAFHDTEPLPTQRRHPLQLQQQQQQQQQAPLYRPSDQRSREVPQLGGFSAFGYPSSGTYHMVPMTVQRSDAASVLVGMHAPSTSSDDWQQRRTKQELEQQQRELQAVTQSRQQQDMQRQLHQLQAQIQQQQQEQAHRHHQAQVQRQVERIQEPRYSSSGLGGFDQTRWNNGAYAQSSAASSFSGADSDRIQGAAMQHGVQMQQNGRFYGGDFQQRAQPVPIRPATTPTGTGSYPAISYGEGSPPAGMLANRNDALFAPQQMPKPAQSHFRARSTNLFGASALQSWGRSESMSLSGMQAARTKSFQMQSDPRFVPQQQQPQPYYAAEPSERKYQEPPARSHASQSVPDVFFLDGIMRHFPASSETVGEAPTRSTAVPARSNCESIEARGNAFEFAPTQYRTQAQPPLGMQTQMEVQSRTTVPPTGAVIVPGVSLASQPIRLVTMRDLLNGDEAKADKSRGRPRGNQQRAPQKRKAPKKKTPAKRQRMPQQPNEQRPQHPPMNRSVRPSQNPSLAPSGGPALASKPASPMYLAFMESRAARALEQKSGTTAANSSTPGIQTPEPQLSILAAQVPARQTSNKSVDLVAAEATPVKQKRGSYKRKKTGFPPESRTQEQSVGTSVPSIPIQATSEPTASSNEQLSELPQASIVTTAKQVDVLVQVNYQANSSCISDDLMNGKFEQRQEPPKLAVPVEATKSVQPSLNTDKAANGNSQFQVRYLRLWGRLQKLFRRDFMRYQAAKIWRRYQEQLKKQEEWREVRVAGKRASDPQQERAYSLVVKQGEEGFD